MPRITQQSEKLISLLLANGIDAKDGAVIAQVRPATDVLTDDEWVAEDGWNNLAILGNDPEFEGGLKFTDITTGFDDTPLHKIYKGRKPTVGLSLMGLTNEGLKMAYGTDTVTFVEPGTPISKTVDTATTPTFKTILLNNVTDLAVGQTLAIVTGTTNPDWELKQIESIDVSGKLVSFKTPLVRLPINAATAKVVLERQVPVGVGRYPDMKMRTIRFHDDGSLGVMQIFKAAMASDGLPKGGKEGAQVSSPKLEMMKDWTVSSGALVERFFTYRDIFPV